MMRQHMGFQKYELIWQALKAEPEVVRALHASFPAGVSRNRSLHLGAGGQPERHDLGRELFRVGACGQSCPSDKHGARFWQGGGWRKRGN